MPTIHFDTLEEDLDPPKVSKTFSLKWKLLKFTFIILSVAALIAIVFAAITEYNEDYEVYIDLPKIPEIPEERFDFDSEYSGSNPGSI